MDKTRLFFFFFFSSSNSPLIDSILYVCILCYNCNNKEGWNEKFGKVKIEENLVFQFKSLELDNLEN